MARFARLVPLVLLTAMALLGLTGSSSSTAVITVDTTTDEIVTNGLCSLREAVLSANTDGAGVADCTDGSGTDLILVPPGTFPLTLNGTQALGDLDLQGSVLVRGAGARQTNVTAGPAFADRIFEVSNVTNAIEDLTISGGNSVVSGGGVNVAISGGLTASRIHVTGNSATEGGGVATNDSGLTLVDSLLSNNIVDEDGAGGRFQGPAELTNVTVSGNRAKRNGGGIFVSHPDSLLLHVTVTANMADSDNAAGGQGGGLYIAHAARIGGTVVSDNALGSTGSGTPDCVRVTLPVSLGYNVVEGACGSPNTFAGPGDIDADGELRALANNGGPTDTHAIRKSSPARNRALSGCPSTDQRGTPRGAPCDSGAYELRFCRKVRVNRIGTAGDDILEGTPGRDGLLGFGGNDRLKGRRGRDGLCGGEGNDRLNGGRGKDRLSGGPDSDRLSGGRRDDRLKGGTGPDLLFGRRGDDRLFGGDGDDDLRGGLGDDRCVGRSGSNSLTGCEL